MKRLKKQHLPKSTFELDEMTLFNDILSSVPPHALGEFMVMMHRKFKDVENQTDITYEQELQLFIHWLDNQDD